MVFIDVHLNNSYGHSILFIPLGPNPNDSKLGLLNQSQALVGWIPNISQPLGIINESPRESMNRSRYHSALALEHKAKGMESLSINSPSLCMLERDLGQRKAGEIYLT